MQGTCRWLPGIRQCRWWGSRECTLSARVRTSYLTSRSRSRFSAAWVLNRFWWDSLSLIGTPFPARRRSALPARSRTSRWSPPRSYSHSRASLNFPVNLVHIRFAAYLGSNNGFDRLHWLIHILQKNLLKSKIRLKTETIVVLESVCIFYPGAVVCRTLVVSIALERH